MFLADAAFMTDSNGELIQLPALPEALPSLPPNDMAMALVKMLLTMVALILLVFGTYWFIRLLIQNRLQKGEKEQLIQVIEKRMISPKTMLYLVQVEDKQILLAESHLEIKRVN